MRKFISMALAVSMVVSMAACSSKKGDTDETLSQTTQAVEETVTVETETAETETTEEQESQATLPMEGSVAENLYQVFTQIMEEGQTTDPEEIANELISQEWIPFMGAAAAVEPGYLAGFTEEIQGFEQGATFLPMIGSIPFVGYIFQLEEGADVDGFVQNLQEKADLAWNICVVADEMKCQAVDNTVFFVMCPAQFED
jgi:hypothetical protein